MKLLPIPLLLLFTIIGLGQRQHANHSNLLTAKYAGDYSFGESVKKGRVRYITIYPETDSTVIFYIEVNNGPTAYNLGSLYGRVKILNDTGTFYRYEDDMNCKWNFGFSKAVLKIKSLDGKMDCGFGYGVYADGVFKRRLNKIVDRFVDLHGDTIYFDSIKH